MPVLDNQRHELFAQAVAGGSTLKSAYQKLYSGTDKSSECNGARLAGTERVSARIRELKEASASASTLTARERREFLARVVRADLERLDVEKDGDLLQEKVITTTEVGTTTKYKLPGKRECVMDDAELAGERKVGVSVTVGVTVREPIDQLRQRVTEAAKRHARN